MKNHIYIGDEFPDYKGKKVTIIKELGDTVQVRVLNESTFVEGAGIWGISFYCKRDELEKSTD